MPSVRHTLTSVTYCVVLQTNQFSLRFLNQADHAYCRAYARHSHDSRCTRDRGTATALSVRAVRTVRAVFPRRALSGLTRIDAVYKPIAVFADIGNVLCPFGSLPVARNDKSNFIVELRRFRRRAAFVAALIILAAAASADFVAVISITAVYVPASVGVPLIVPSSES